MVSPRFLTFSLAGIGAAALCAQQGHDVQRRKARDHIGHLFHQRCASCHTVPDPALPTDLAWLDQVNRTS